MLKRETGRQRGELGRVEEGALPVRKF